MIAGTALILCDMTVLKNRKIEPVPNWYLFAIGGLLGLIKGCVTDPIAHFIFHIDGITFENAFIRSVNATVLGTMAIPLIALMSYSWHVLGEAKKLTLADIESIEILLGVDNDPRIQKDLLSAAKERLKVAQAEFRGLFIDSGVHRNEDVANYLREAANRIIRPLSHEIAEQPNRRAFAGTHVGEFLSLVPDTIMRIAPWMLALSAASTVQTFFKLYSINLAIFMFILNLVLIYLALIAIHQILKKITINGFTIALVGLSIFEAQSWFLHVVHLLLYDGDKYLSPWISGLWTLLAFAIVCSAGIFTSTQLEYISTLQEEYSRKYSEILRRDQSQRLVSTQLARYLHGTLQTRLITSAYRIRHLDSESQDELDRELQQVLEHFDLPDKLTDSTTGKNLSEQISAVVKDWTPLLKISVDIQTKKDLFSPAIQSDICDVINESLSNALRHGGASEAQVQVSEKSNALLISVRDNGRGLGGDLTGLGSNLFDRVSNRTWELSRDENSHVTILELYLPI